MAARMAAPWGLRPGTPSATAATTNVVAATTLPTARSAQIWLNSPAMVTATAIAMITA